MKLFATIGDETREFIVDGEQVTVDGVAMRTSLNQIPGTPMWRLDLDGLSHLLVVRHLGGGRWEVHDRGDQTEVLVQDQRTRHIRGLVGGAKRHRAGGEVLAPMPGLVTRVLVSPGDTVTAGSGLVILEAMKMENQLTAPGEARVTRVVVAAGQTVEKGQVLVELSELQPPPPTSP